MKTVLQALKDEIYYPVNIGLLENKLQGRDLDGGQSFSRSVQTSPAWKGALADSLISLIQAVNISEGDKSYGSLTDAQRKALLKQANKLYDEIGEDEVTLDLHPTVYINC